MGADEPATFHFIIQVVFLLSTKRHGNNGKLEPPNLGGGAAASVHLKSIHLHATNKKSHSTFIICSGTEFITLQNTCVI